ncbi:uncharacterized protein LOC144471862 [Augochlora pura]
MWKIFCPLLLMLFTFDHPRDRSARAEPVRASPELAPRDDDQSHPEEDRKRGETKSDSSRFPFYEDEENSSERIGRWRKNGEALEPKWRDGDTVPLLPFSQLTRYSTGDLDNIGEDEDDSNQRRSKYKQTQETLFLRNTERTSYGDHRDYELMEEKGGARKEESPSRRKNNRPVNAFKPQTTSSNGKQMNPEDIAEHREATSTKYREAFQVRPNDYEHELDDEEYLKPRPRKRRPPQNYEFALTENETSRPEAGGPWSRPSGHTVSTDSESRSQFVKNAMELKSLLKMQQEEGLSLSELLQRRNLTLNDLLKGRVDAINALKSKDADAEDYVDEKSTIAPFARLTTKKPERADAEIGRPKNSLGEGIISIVPAVVDLHENATGSSKARLGQSTTGKSLDTEPPRVRGTPAAGVLSPVTTSMPFPVATNSMELLRSEETTAKLRGNGEIRIDGLDEDEIMEFSDFPDYKNGRNPISPVWLTVKDGNGETPEMLRENYEDKGSTLSIEQLLHPTERSTSTSENEKRTSAADGVTIVRPGKDEYNMYMEHEYQDDESAVYSDRNVEVTTSTEKSYREKTVTGGVEIVLDSMVGRNSTENHETVPNEADYTFRHQHDVNETAKKSYDDIISEVEPEARAEIFELFASGSAGKRLERLLKSRNMSLEELIALRQRGSSKVHLADVSRIKVPKFSDENGEKKSAGEGRAIGSGYDKRMNGYLTESYTNLPKSVTNPVRFVQSEEITTGKSLSTVTTSKIEDGSVLDANEDIVGRREEQIVDLLTTFGSLPIAKDIQRKFADEFNREERRKVAGDGNDLDIAVANNREIVGANKTANTIQSGFVKEIVKQEPSSIDIRTIYSETDVFNDDEDKSEKGRALSKIRPSIIASGAILGVTIVVFLAIFITCRIRQKQKYRYRNTFSRAVFQGPMLAARKLSNSSSLSTVMVNVIATSTTKRPEKHDTVERARDMDTKSDIDNDSLDANDSWETIPDYMK